MALLLSLLFGHPTARAESDMASEISTTFNAEEFSWAYGMVIDTISVTGNVKTKSIALLRELETAPQRVAVEVNRELVPRSTFEEKVLAQGDRIEVVTFVGGG